MGRFNIYFIRRKNICVPAVVNLGEADGDGCSYEGTYEDNSCNEVGISYWTPLEYDYSETINIVNSYNLEVTVEEDGEWLVWTFDFPTETWEGNGQLPLGLIIATDGLGKGPAFQIHNNDGSDATYPWGTWLMSPFDTELVSDCEWLGWHSGCVNTPVTDLDWVEATGAYYGQNTNGILTIKIKKEVLGDSFHWAAYPQTGGGWYSPYKNQQMPTPEAFNWATPTVAEDNYHEATIMEALTNSVTVSPSETVDFLIVTEFPKMMIPGTYTITTTVVPAE